MPAYPVDVEEVYGSGRRSLSRDDPQIVRMYNVAWSDLDKFSNWLLGDPPEVMPHEDPSTPKFYAETIDVEPLGAQWDNPIVGINYDTARLTVTYRPDADLVNADWWYRKGEIGQRYYARREWSVGGQFVPIASEILRFKNDSSPLSGVSPGIYQSQLEMTETIRFLKYPDVIAVMNSIGKQRQIYEQFDQYGNPTSNGTIFGYALAISATWREETRSRPTETSPAGRRYTAQVRYLVRPNNWNHVLRPNLAAPEYQQLEIRQASGGWIDFQPFEVVPYPPPFYYY
jgi:hypothetical protein